VLDRDRTVIAIAAKAHAAPKEIVGVQRTPIEQEADDYVKASDYLEQTMPDIVRELGVQALKELVAQKRRSRT
jgi:hypothetical protein